MAAPVKWGDASYYVGDEEDSGGDVGGHPRGRGELPPSLCTARTDLNTVR